MRENRTFTAKTPETRNDFISLIKGKATVIVLKNSLLSDLDKELNNSKGNKAPKKIAKGLGILGLIAGLTNPLIWLYSIACFAVGGLTKDEIKGYDVYSGMDTNGKSIIVLIRKKDYDSKYDKIIYDKSYVRSVSEKPMRGKIKA